MEKNIKNTKKSHEFGKSDEIIKKIKKIVEKEPKTGRELHRFINIDTFDLWRICMKNFIVLSVARHYLRLDKDIKGFARLSPSILREFMTYSIIGTDKDKIREKAKILKEKIKKISEKKFNLGKKISLEVIRKTNAKASFLIAGDVALGMAHDEPKLERYTNTLVRGSDIDIVIIIDSEKYRSPIEEHMLSIKHRCIKDPRIREEVDFKIKNINEIIEDSKFDSLKKMIACKIICESKYLAGSYSLYKEAKEIVKKVCENLKIMEKDAFKKRKEVLKKLISDGIVDKEHAVIFYGTEEFYEEF